MRVRSFGQGVCGLFIAGLVSSSLVASASATQPASYEHSSIIPVLTSATTKASVTAVDATTQQPAAGANSRKRCKKKPGVSVSQIRVTNRGNMIRGKIRWSCKLLKKSRKSGLSKSGRKHRFSTQLVAHRGENKKPKHLISTSKKQVKKRKKKLRIQLSAKQAKIVKKAHSVSIVASQKQARKGRGRTKFHRGYSAHSRYVGHNTKCQHRLLRRGADLSHCDLSHANLSHLDLSRTDLTGANLSYTNFRCSNLNYADLRKANLQGTRFNNCTKLKGALFDPEPQYVYWADNSNYLLRRAEIAADRTFKRDPDWKVPTTPSSVNPQTSAVLVDEEHVYWLNQSSTLHRATLDGKSRDPDWKIFVTGGADLTGLAQDADYIYWAATGTGNIQRAAKKTPEGAIDPKWKVVADPIGVGGSTPRGLASDGTYLFWGDNSPGGNIGMAPIDNPTSTKHAVVPQAAGQKPFALSASAGLLWWTHDAPVPTKLSSIPTTDLTGPVGPTISGPPSSGSQLRAVAANGLNVLWQNTTEKGDNTIGIASLGGKEFAPFDTGTGQLGGVGVDPNYDLPPTVTAVSPSSGPTAATGDTVTVTGTGFTDGGQVTVSLGRIPCDVKSVATDGTSLKCAPGKSTKNGPVDATVTNKRSQTGDLKDAYTYLSPAPLAQIPLSPPGFYHDGKIQLLTVRPQSPASFAIGSDLKSTAKVTLGGNDCPVDLGKSTSDALVCTLPTPSTVGPVNVKVDNPYSEPGKAQENAFWYLPEPPEPTNIRPASGKIAGGTPVTISGTEFHSDATVKIGDITCTEPKPTRDGKTITCVTGESQTNGRKAVVVTNPPPPQSPKENAQSGTIPDGGGYTYMYPAPTVSSISPAAGTKLGAQRVEITGTGFQDGPTATIGGKACVGAETASPTKLSCFTPRGDVGAARVVVMNPDQQSSTQEVNYTYTEPSPTVTSIAPATGSLQGETTVTIKGSGFDSVSATTVKVGAAPCAVSTVQQNGDELTCVTSQNPVGQVDVKVSNGPNLTGQLDKGYTYGTPQYLYWADNNKFILRRTPITGQKKFQNDTAWQVKTTPSSNPPQTSAVVVDQDHLYWLNALSSTLHRSTLGDQTIDPDWKISVTGGANVTGIAQDTDHIYWAAKGTGKIQRAAKQPTPASIDTTWSIKADPQNPISGSTPQGLASDGTSLYWGDNSSGGNIGMAPIDNPTSIKLAAVPQATGQKPSALSVAAGKLWWTHDYLSPANVSAISTSALGGTLAPSLSNPPSPIDNAQAVTANGLNVFWANFTGNTIGYAALDGTEFTDLATDTANLGGVGVDPDLLPLTITGVSPTSGAAAGGEEVKVTGSGFKSKINDPVTVTLGGVGCEVKEIQNDRSLTCVTGARTGGTVSANVFTQLRTATKANAYEYKNPKPTVDHIEPSSGPTAGNTTVTIYGTGFLSGAVVTFESSTYKCQSVAVAPDGQSLTCKTPAHPAGTVPVTVSVGGQTSDNPATYTYADAGTLYWTNSANMNPKAVPSCQTPAPPNHGGSVASAASDGSSQPNQCLVVTNDPSSTVTGVASDANHVYWANPGEGYIGRASPQGTDVNEKWADLSNSASTQAPRDIVIQGEYLYWSDPGNKVIKRIKLGDPSVPDTQWKVATQTDAPKALAVDATHIYWVDSSKGIGRATLTNSPVIDTQWKVTGDQNQYTGVAVDSSHVYWSILGSTGQVSGYLNRATLTTPNVVDSTFNVTEIQPQGITIGPTYVYWTDTLSQQGTQVGSATIGRSLLTKNGSAGSDIHFLTDATQPIGITLK